MTIMGDWIDADYTSKKFTDYGWTTTPGNAGIYDALSDGFGLPKGAKDVEQVKNWLRMIGTPEAQDIFNPLKGSVPVNVYAGNGAYDPYLKSAIADWKSQTVVASLAHGAAASESWLGSHLRMRWRSSSSNRMSPPRRQACSRTASKPESANSAAVERRAAGRY